MMKKLMSIWIILSIIILTVMVFTINTSFPIFTYVWLIVSLIFLIKQTSRELGVKKTTVKKLIKYTLLHFLMLTIIYLIFEPWSNTYKLLIDLAFNSTPADPTFVWLNYNRNYFSYLLIFLITFFITIFGEELFFRGLLFQKLKNKVNIIWTVVIQAALFALPNTIVAFLMPTNNSIIYIFVYAFLAVGCVGGYTAAKTDSIWPSLISASIMNLVLVLIYF